MMRLENRLRKKMTGSYQVSGVVNRGKQRTEGGQWLWVCVMGSTVELFLSRRD